MSPRAVPVRIRYTLSTALENSHSETDTCLRAFCRSESSSGLPIFISLTFQLVLKAMNRCGDAAAAVDESITGEGIHGHDGRIT